MGADTSAERANSPTARRTPMVAAITVRDRVFWGGLACAAVVHAALLVGFIGSPPRRMGEAGGLADGISVELVEVPDPKSKNTFAEDGGQPGAAAKPAPKQPPQQQQAAAEPPPPAADQSPQATPQPAEKQKADPWVADTAAPDRAKPPPAEDQAKRSDQPAKPARKQQPAEQIPPPPQPKPQQKLSLQFDLPQLSLSPGTRGAAVTRPAGVTRSGENDEFGRGVIRALRRTMPASNTLGRVTVRFLLSHTGNLLEVRLVSGGGDPILNQNVVFAVKQASFPFPPPGATEVDRTFQVTYVYH